MGALPSTATRPNVADVGDFRSDYAQLSRVGGREVGWRARNEPAIARNLPSQKRTFATVNLGSIADIAARQVSGSGISVKPQLHIKGPIT